MLRPWVEEQIMAATISGRVGIWAETIVASGTCVSSYRPMLATKRNHKSRDYPVYVWYL